MKKPKNLSKVKFEYNAPLHEFGWDVRGEEAIRAGKIIKSFYFGYAHLCIETILVYLLVKKTNNIFTFKCYYLYACGWLISYYLIFLHLQLVNDRHFLHGVHRAVLQRASMPGVAPTYVYRFSFDSPTFCLIKSLFAEKTIPGKVRCQPVGNRSQHDI